MAISLGTNDVVVTRIHCTIPFLHYLEDFEKLAYHAYLELKQYDFKIYAVYQKCSYFTAMDILYCDQLCFALEIHVIIRTGFHMSAHVLLDIFAFNVLDN